MLHSVAYVYAGVVFVLETRVIVCPSVRPKPGFGIGIQNQDQVSVSVSVP